MKRKAAILIAVGLVLILAGVGGYLAKGTRLENEKATQQPVTCSQPINPLDLNSKGQVRYSCAATGNSTLQVNFKGTQVASVLVTFVDASGTVHLLYNSSTKSFTGTFPVSINGTFNVQIANKLQTVNKISGSVTVNSEETIDVEVPVTVHPYRYYGAGSGAAGAVLLVYVYWKESRKIAPSLSK